MNTISKTQIRRINRPNLRSILAVTGIFMLTACQNNDNTPPPPPPPPANTAPTASNVSISDDNGGEAVAGDDLTGNYTYADTEGDAEGNSTFRWLGDGAAISGATAASYTLTAADAPSQITFEVTPVAATGSATGTSVTSAALATVVQPVVSGVAKYFDSNANGRKDANDQLIVTFNQEVISNAAMASDFDLPVLDDQFGAGATVASGPQDNEVTILLGVSPAFNTANVFSDTATDLRSPSGINISSSMAADAIESTSGVDAVPATAIDIIPAFVDSLQSLASNFGRSATLGDVDGDGDLDIAVGSDTTVGNRVSLNNGDGTFTDSGQSLDTGGTQTVVLGDVDGDGDLDMVSANAGNEPNSVYVNDGNGVYTDSGQSLGSNWSISVALGDVDNDGDLDMAVANFNNQGNQVYLNDGAGSFDSFGVSLGTDSSHSVALGDLDGDGDLDMAVANNDNAQANRVYVNDGTGVYTDSGQSLGSNLSVSVALGDIDNDGDLDMVVANFGLGNRVYINDGNASFSDSDQSLGSFDSQIVSLGDIDGDGDLDMVVANENAQANRVYHNDGSGIFTDSTQALGANDSRSIALGDVDGDSDLDIVVANRSAQGNNQVYFGSSFNSGDTWDVDQGASIISSSGVGSGALENMFGGNAPQYPSAEFGTAFFQDTQGTGFTHFVEWQSAAPITLTGYRLQAIDEPGVVCCFPGGRGFTAFRLFAFDVGTGSFQLVDTYVPASNPYPDNRVDTTRTLSVPVVAQIFRAEFDQYLGGSFAGPRILELDAISD